MNLGTTKASLIVLLGAYVLTPAAAQGQKPDPFDFMVADIRVMQDKGVQADMGISKAQRDKMNVLAKQHTDRVLAYQKSLKDTKPSEENKKKVELQLVKYLQQLKTNVVGVLSKTQLKRLREITLQGYGWTAVADERVGKRVGMSASQIQKVKSILSESTKKANTLQQNAAAPILAPYKDKKPKNEAEAKQWDAKIQAGMKQAGLKIKPQLDSLQTKMVKDVQAVLTAKQRAAYLQLQGKRFTPK